MPVVLVVMAIVCGLQYKWMYKYNIILYYLAGIQQPRAFSMGMHDFTRSLCRLLWRVIIFIISICWLLFFSFFPIRFVPFYYMRAAVFIHSVSFQCGVRQFISVWVHVWRIIHAHDLSRISVVWLCVCLAIARFT